MQSKSFADKVLSRNSLGKSCNSECDHFMFIEPNGKRIHHITLNMNDVTHVKTPIQFKQYDYGSSYIYVKLVYDEEPLDLNDVVIVGSFKDFRGNIFVDESNQPIKANAKALESEKGVILLPIPKRILRSRSEIRCEMVLFNQNYSRLTSPSFSFTIEESILEYEIEDVNPSGKKAVCGEVLCGEVLCGEGLDNKNTKTSSLGAEFLQRFGGVV